MGHPNCFGIRHLSPAGAYHLRSFLDEKQPDLILVEGPSDFNGLMDDMVRAVSYTHLDVYKRQSLHCSIWQNRQKEHRRPGCRFNG